MILMVLIICMEEYSLSTWRGHGVGYRSFTEPHLDSCGVFKDAVFSILATIAKQERLRLDDGAGAWPGPRMPLGLNAQQLQAVGHHLLPIGAAAGVLVDRAMPGDRW